MSEQNVSKMAGDTGTEIEDINDADIREIQVLRKGFIDQLAKNGQLPGDKEDRQALLTLMNQTTTTAIANKRIKADEKAATSNIAVVQNLAEVIRMANATASAAHRKAMLNKNREVPVVEVNKVAGHTDIGFLPIATATVSNASKTAEEALDQSKTS